MTRGGANNCSKMQIFKGLRTQLFTMVVLCYDKVKLGYERSELPGLTLLGVHSFFQGFLEAVKISLAFVYHQKRESLRWCTSLSQKARDSKMGQQVHFPGVTTGVAEFRTLCRLFGAQNPTS
jgi:hypothetical protein